MQETSAKAGRMAIKRLETPPELGACAAEDVAECVKKLLGQQEQVNMIFAAAPSQNDFLEALRSRDDIEWERINAFHMDEYIGLSARISWGVSHSALYIILTDLQKIFSSSVSGMQYYFVNFQ